MTNTRTPTGCKIVTTDHSTVNTFNIMKQHLTEDRELLADALRVYMNTVLLEQLKETLRTFGELNGGEIVAMTDKLSRAADIIYDLEEGTPVSAIGIDGDAYLQQKEEDK